MKKDIGAVLGLYPTPLVVVGAMVEGRANWWASSDMTASC